mmetsp:Transcript_24923/g.58840  ORF Transcript_24923/g.58840 Transcript_24923/m.58840 type:complete len:86 (+) Transcript_24923:35-292(+)
MLLPFVPAYNDIIFKSAMVIKLQDTRELVMLHNQHVRLRFKNILKISQCLLQNDEHSKIWKECSLHGIIASFQRFCVRIFLSREE